MKGMIGRSTPSQASPSSSSPGPGVCSLCVDSEFNLDRVFIVSVCDAISGTSTPVLWQESFLRMCRCAASECLAPFGGLQV